ncbi:MAG: type I DNA topoisomerase [Acidimicrobiia bacterium]|nr:type I DNA topoisomerase [Acidimicrobiia bacterium]
MAKNLVIVESPAKAKTINKYLGSAYKVKASMGHVRDLPKSTLGVKVNGDVEVKYLVPKDKKDVVKELRDELKKAETLWLATDLDREGEAIAWHLQEALKADPARVRRVTFSEITQEAVREAFEHPREIEMELVDAQQARRVIDRFVGYRLSPVLWDAVEGGRSLSAGRVQSVTVRLVVDREREIDAFEEEEYYSVWVRLAKGDTGVTETFDARLLRVDGEELTFTSRPRLVLTPEADGSAPAGESTVSYNGAVTSREDADTFRRDLESAAYRVAEVRTQERKRRPSAPFTTSTLQQEASRRLGFGARRTMGLAQRLYEGLEMPDEGQVGLITYMRTDSVNLSALATEEIGELVRTDFGAEYTEGERTYKSRAKGAQEAHEAIRPTSAMRRPDLVEAALGDGDEARDLARLYRLIWQRTVASQMTDARLLQVSADIEATPQEATRTYTLRATGQVVLFDGFLAVYVEEEEAGEQERQESGDEIHHDEGRLPELAAGDGLDARDVDERVHATKPPPRYTEASLVKKLEELGIGRPSTYAPTLSTVLEREYVELESKRFFPTELGISVNDFLVDQFPEYVDYGFTAKMEDDLDHIAEGSEDWKPTVRGFWDELERRIDKVMGGCPQCGAPLEFRTGFRGRRYVACTHSPDDCDFQRPIGARDGNWAPEPLDEECPDCGEQLVKKRGRFGWFIACSGYPACNYSRPTDEEAAELEATDETCEACGRPMVVKRGRYGKFLGCSGYPECKTVKRIEETTGVKCPKCSEGDLVVRRTKRRRTFYSCSRYPECDFSVWERPFTEPCPSCGGLLVGASDTLTCNDCKEKFERSRFESASDAGRDAEVAAGSG